MSYLQEPVLGNSYYLCETVGERSVARVVIVGAFFQVINNCLADGDMGPFVQGNPVSGPARKPEVQISNRWAVMVIYRRDWQVIQQSYVHQGAP